ncbi:MAG TPA: alanine racemase [Solirubrobacterales bacterium]|nr:alanine racemase [Solirubrobacterales bacterium]
MGVDWTEVESPALFVDLAVAQENIAAMAGWASEVGVEIRPHFKAHKCVELARLQVEAGAVGLTVATLEEALALLDAGLDDILIANQVVLPAQVERLAVAARRGRIAVLVDDPANLEGIAAAARRAGSEVRVLIEVDTGMGRCGMRQPKQTARLAELAVEAQGVHFAGVSGYEGHVSPIEDQDERAARAREAIAVLGDHAEAIRAEGIEVEIVSAGGTSTFRTTGADPRVTELQPGAYVLMDVARRRLVSEFQIALWIGTTVISRQGSHGVLDCGHKGVSSLGGPPDLTGGWGEIASIHEEHLCFLASGPEPALGEMVRIDPGFGPMTINLYDRLHVLSGGAVIEEWPVAARR